MTEQSLKIRSRHKYMSRSFSTCDLCDAFGDRCQVCETQLRHYGGRRTAFGRIRPVRCLGANLLIRQLLEMKTMGEILVIYGGAPLRTRSDGKYSRLRGSKGWSGAIRMYRRPGFLWQCKLYAQALALQRRRWHPRFESSVASLDRDSALKAHLSATLPWSLAQRSP
jgi:hypothetical protein